MIAMTVEFFGSAEPCSIACRTLKAIPAASARSFWVKSAKTLAAIIVRGVRSIHTPLQNMIRSEGHPYKEDNSESHLIGLAGF
jgi:hypothetical protein